MISLVNLLQQLDPDTRSFLINLLASLIFAMLVWIGRKRTLVFGLLILCALLVEIFDFPDPSLLAPIPRSLYSVLFGCLGTGGLVWTLRTRFRMDTNQRLLDDIGLLRVYPKGLVADYIVADYSYIEKAQAINMLSISRRGLLEVKSHLQNAILNNNAVVQILILHPDSRFVKEREQQEGYELRRGQIRKECQATIDRAKELSLQIRSENARRVAKGLTKSTGRIEVRAYDTMPYCSCVITEKLVRYTPYLIYERAGYTPAYDFAPSSELAAAITRHFDALWERAEVEFYDDFYLEKSTAERREN